MEILGNSLGLLYYKASENQFEGWSITNENRNFHKNYELFYFDTYILAISEITASNFISNTHDFHHLNVKDNLPLPLVEADPIPVGYMVFHALRIPELNTLVSD